MFSNTISLWSLGASDQVSYPETKESKMMMMIIIIIIIIIIQLILER
jgi:hypothetical protein